MDEELRQLVRSADAHQASIARIRQAVDNYVTELWGSLGAHRDADIDRFAARVVPVIAGAQRNTASQTLAYLRQASLVTLGEPPPTSAVRASDFTGAAVRRIDPLEEYRRPGKTVWTALSEGKSYEAAVAAGLRRALDLANTDLTLASTHAFRAGIAGDDRVVGYRRKLASGDNCGLCIVASTQRYHKEDLLPIHPNCGCVPPVAIYGDRDPGQILEPELLESVHQAIEDTFGVSDRGARDPIDYRQVLLTREHGEIGPVLTVSHHRFTSLADL